MLPSGLVAGVLATFPLHWVLYSTLSNFVEPYPELPERLLSPFVIAAVFIWVGSRIAPDYKVETSVVLLGLWMALLGGFVFLTLSGAGWMGRQLYFQGRGVGAVMALAGAITALYIVRRERTRTGTVQREIGGLKNEKAKLQREVTKAERELAESFLRLSPEDPDLVVDVLLDEFGKSDIGEGTPEKYAGDALVAWTQGDRETALGLYTNCIELSPDDGVAFLNRGNLQLEMGYFDAGINDIERAREIDPELPWQNVIIFKRLNPEQREAMRQRILEKKGHERRIPPNSPHAP